MRRTKAEAALTRQAILRSALAVFSTRGYAAARLEDVARMAGVTRGAIYWHFQGKPELFQALLETYSARVHEVVSASIDQAENFTEVIGGVFSGLLGAIETDRSLQAVLELSLFKTEGLAELRTVQRRQAEAAESLLQILAGVLRRAAASGDLRTGVPPELAARALLGLLNGVVQQWLLSPRSFSLQDTAPWLSRMFLDGFARH
jgi:TetR/AcrR family transcriptional regulator, acrAB operon repressor